MQPLVFERLSAITGRLIAGEYGFLYDLRGAAQDNEAMITKEVEAAE